MINLLEHFLLRHPSVRFVRLQWQDGSGILRARVVPVEQARRLARGDATQQIAPCSLDLAVENSVREDPTNFLGSDTCRPDWCSLRTRTSLDPLYASVMCGIARDNGPEARRKNVCARSALETVLSKASEMLQLEFLIGFEVEFEVWERTDNGQLALHSTGMGGSACSGLRHRCYEYVEEALLILLEAGVGIEGMHTEGKEGQYELNLAPKPPMEAVDELVFVHDTLKRVFARHGLIATMFPRPAAKRTQSIGQHVHISLTNHQELEQAFLAGVLNRLPSLVACCLPYALSYERLGPGQAGVAIVSWGTQDRRGPVRKVKTGHWELRCVDATANMYLVLAAVLGAGLRGCMNHESLRHRDTSTLSNECIENEYMQNEGIASMPDTLEDALCLLDEDYESQFGLGTVAALMESQVIEHYSEMKKFEQLKLIEMREDLARMLLTELF